MLFENQQDIFQIRFVRPNISFNELYQEVSSFFKRTQQPKLAFIFNFLRFQLAIKLVQSIKQNYSDISLILNLKKLRVMKMNLLQSYVQNQLHMEVVFTRYVLQQDIFKPGFWPASQHKQECESIYKRRLKTKQEMQRLRLKSKRNLQWSSESELVRTKQQLSSSRRITSEGIQDEQILKRQLIHRFELEALQESVLTFQLATGQRLPFSGKIYANNRFSALLLCK